VRPLRLISAGLAIAALAFPVTAAADVQLRGVDSGSYPAIRGAVVTTKPSGAPPIVTENGQTVTGLQATNLARGKCVALAVDRSQSMKGKPLAEAVAAARGFIAAKPRSDRIAITSFATKPVFLSGCSAEGGEALEALETIVVDPKQGTTLYDDLVLAAGKLNAEKGSGRVIIMVTDGNETRSKASLEDAIAAAQKAGIAVYVVAIESSKFNPEPLKEIATQTGGRYFGASSSTAIKGIYATIARELARTWRFEYLTSARPADEIQVKASVVGEGSAAQTLTIEDGDRLQPTPPSKLFPKDAYGPGGPLAVAGLVGFLVLLACLFFLSGIRGSWVRSRIAVHIGEGKKGSSKQNRREKRSEMLSSLFRATERAFGNLKQWRWVSVMLERADVPLRTVEFFWIVVGAGMGAAMIGLLLGMSPVILIILVVVAGSIPFAWIWLKMRKRLRAFEDQLPDLLITIAASLKAGHSFKQGLQAVVDEGHPPASEELRRVMTETSLGRPMDDALAEMAERMGSKNFEFAITAVTIQRQVGGSLATLFDMVADTVRQRQQFARKIRALTAMGRMSAYTLIGIPFFIAGVITLLNRSYMSPLYHTSTGQIMIVVALVMMALGSLFLKKIVSFRG
jgi:tight adherence protein B